MADAKKEDVAGNEVVTAAKTDEKPSDKVNEDASKDNKSSEKQENKESGKEDEKKENEMKEKNGSSSALSEELTNLKKSIIPSFGFDGDLVMTPMKKLKSDDSKESKTEENYEMVAVYRGTFTLPIDISGKYGEFKLALRGGEIEVKDKNKADELTYHTMKLMINNDNKNQIEINRLKDTIIESGNGNNNINIEIISNNDSLVVDCIFARLLDSNNNYIDGCDWYVINIACLVGQRLKSDETMNFFNKNVFSDKCSQDEQNRFLGYVKKLGELYDNVKLMSPLPHGKDVSTYVAVFVENGQTPTEKTNNNNNNNNKNNGILNIKTAAIKIALGAVCPMGLIIAETLSIGDKGLDGAIEILDQIGGFVESEASSVLTGLKRFDAFMKKLSEKAIKFVKNAAEKLKKFMAKLLPFSDIKKMKNNLKMFIVNNMNNLLSNNGNLESKITEFGDECKKKVCNFLDLQDSIFENISNNNNEIENEFDNIIKNAISKGTTAIGTMVKVTNVNYNNPIFEAFDKNNSDNIFEENSTLKEKFKDDIKSDDKSDDIFDIISEMFVSMYDCAINIFNGKYSLKELITKIFDSLKKNLYNITCKITDFIVLLLKKLLSTSFEDWFPKLKNDSIKDIINFIFGTCGDNKKEDDMTLLDVSLYMGALQVFNVEHSMGMMLVSLIGDETHSFDSSKIKLSSVIGDHKQCDEITQESGKIIHNYISDDDNNNSSSKSGNSNNKKIEKENNNSNNKKNNNSNKGNVVEKWWLAAFKIAFCGANGRITLYNALDARDGTDNSPVVTWTSLYSGVFNFGAWFSNVILASKNSKCSSFDIITHIWGYISIALNILSPFFALANLIPNDVTKKVLGILNPCASFLRTVFYMITGFINKNYWPAICSIFRAFQIVLDVCIKFKLIKDPRAIAAAAVVNCISSLIQCGLWVANAATK